MSLLYDQQKIHQQKLDRFRQSFLLLIQDGQYPPERQHRLYQSTIQAGLDWNEARKYVRRDAEQFFQRYVTAVLAQGPITHEVAAELNRLRRRLNLDASVTENLSVSAPAPALAAKRLPPLPAHMPPTPAPVSAPTPTPSVWSDMKMMIGVVILTPIIWLGLVFLTAFGLIFLSLFVNLTGLLPLASFLDLFVAIFLAVRVMRRWSRPVPQRSTYSSAARPPARPAPLPQPMPAQPAPYYPPQPMSAQPAPYYPPQPMAAPYQPQPYTPLPLNQYAPQRQRQPRPVLSGAGLAQSVQHLSGAEFEHWVKDRLADLGWQQLRVMGGRADRGVDIRGIYNGKKCIVQCKHYRGRMVPPNEVRALVGTRNIQRAQRAYLITSGQFGYQCFQEAHKKPVELWDLETLATHLNNQAVPMA